MRRSDLLRRFAVVTQPSESARSKAPAGTGIPWRRLRVVHDRWRGPGVATARRRRRHRTSGYGRRVRRRADKAPDEIVIVVAIGPHARTTPSRRRNRPRRRALRRVDRYSAWRLGNEDRSPRPAGGHDRDVNAGRVDDARAPVDRFAVAGDGPCCGIRPSSQRIAGPLGRVDLEPGQARRRKAPEVDAVGRGVGGRAPGALSRPRLFRL